MDWAHLQSVRSPYAQRLQREAQRAVAVEKEEDDNIDERMRVLREVNQFTAGRHLKSDIARRLIGDRKKGHYHEEIGTTILDLKSDAMASIAQGRSMKLKAHAADSTSPRARSGKKEALREILRIRRAEIAREFPHIQWANPADLLSVDSTDDMSTDDDADSSSGADDSPMTDILRDERAEEPAQSGESTEQLPEADEVSGVQPIAQLNFTPDGSPRPTTSDEQSSPRLATPPERPQTVPSGSPTRTLGGLPSPTTPTTPVAISPWHLDSLANRSRKGLSTQLSKECLPIVMVMNSTVTSSSTRAEPTSHRTRGHSNQRSNTVPVLSGGRVPRIHRMSRSQRWRQQEEREASGEHLKIWMKKAPAQQASPNGRPRPPHETSLSAISAKGHLQETTMQDPPQRRRGVDILDAARSSICCSTSALGQAVTLTPPRGSISPRRHTSKSVYGGSVSARPTTLTDWAPNDTGIYGCCISTHTLNGGDSCASLGMASAGTQGIQAEVSLSSLLSQSSRRLAQTYRSSDTRKLVSPETSQSSFTRMRKRGGVAKSVLNSRSTFGGGFSTGSTRQANGCTKPGDHERCTSGSIRKGRPPPSDSWATQPPCAG